MRIFGKGFNFSQDGPGNRLVYHLSGCNMHCPWCSNPEGMAYKEGKEVSPNDIISECLSSRPMFFSGGGVTFTGGEATLQHDELLFILKELKKNGIHTAIETNGTSEKLPLLSEFIDYLIMDFKHFDNSVLKDWTGVGNLTIKKNIEALISSGKKLHIRIPLINNFNADSPEKFTEYFSRFASEKIDFEFLPYHEYGKDKWKTEYKIKNGFISKETLKHFIDTFEKSGLKTINS